MHQAACTVPADCMTAFIAASLQWEKLRKSDKLPHLNRWYTFLNSLSPLQEQLEAHALRKNVAAESKDAGKGGGKGGAKPGAGMLSQPHVDLIVYCNMI